MSRPVAIAASALAAAWLLAYGPTVAGGFIRDDFAWIYHSQVTGWRSIYAIFADSYVFYRPMVQLSFGLTELIFGTDPLPYGLTNLALGAACACSVYALARALHLAPWAAVAASAIWAFNFHGINMAIIWLSGRTSLLGTLFSVLAAVALLKHRGAAAGVLAFAAFLSKEEVVALPVIFTAWLLINRSSLKTSIGSWIALAVYLVLRQSSGAIGVGNAPPYYQFTFDPVHVARNILEYADRSMTLCVITVAAAAIALRRRPVPAAAEWRVVLMGAVWLVCGFAATIWLPVRSSLYAVFPSVGAAVAAGALLTAVVRAAEPQRAWRLAVASVLVPFLLLPVYQQRNVRWTELRQLSTETIRAIDAARPGGPALVVLHDDLSTRANFRHVFAALLPEASALMFDDVSLWIEPPPPEIDPAARPAAPGRVVTFHLMGGRVQPAPSRSLGND